MQFGLEVEENIVKNKVAIMTWYKYKNYGTVLQCVALFHSIKRSGFEPTLISYDTSVGKYLFPSTSPFCESMKAMLKRNLNSTYTSDSYDSKFKDFLKQRIVESDCCQNYMDLYALNNQFDTFVCGSDQIWSPSNSFDDKYYLSFVEQGKNLVSYAPSFGMAEIKYDEQKDVIKGLLNRFDSISVREAQGAKIVEDLTGHSPQVVLDPTLLLSSNEWDEFAGVNQCRKIDGQYILCYFLGDDKRYMKNVKKISAQKGIPYFVIPVFSSQKKYKNCVPFEVGPSEFVSLVKNATYVCTDSFHGTVFSTIYNVPFSVYERFSDHDENNQNSRIYNLLNMLGLNDRLKLDCWQREYSYKSVNAVIERKRSESLAYLLNALRATSNFSERKRFLTQKMCTGCGACKTACPTGAISIAKNRFGFYQYSILSDKCANCGQCKTVCPVINQANHRIKDSLALYSYQSKDENALQKSSSGGAAYDLAVSLINKGYVVCGAAYDSNTESVHHIIVERKEDLEKLQGSKYLQSNMEDCMRILLNSQKPVAFFGTPCQTAALDHLLRKKGMREQAVLIDLVCHGVPSSLIWEKYLSEKRKEYHTSDKITCVFRDKSYSWTPKVISLSSYDQKIFYHMKESKDAFYSFFNRPISYMPTCYECQYRERSLADIRLGDFWGSEYRNNKKGVSLVIVNTDIGMTVFASCREGVLKAFDVLDYSKIQYIKNPPKPIFYRSVLEDMSNPSISLQELEEKYCVYYKKLEKAQHYRVFASKIKKKLKRK